MPALDNYHAQERQAHQRSSRLDQISRREQQQQQKAPRKRTTRMTNGRRATARIQQESCSLQLNASIGGSLINLKNNSKNDYCQSSSQSGSAQPLRATPAHNYAGSSIHSRLAGPNNSTGANSQEQQLVGSSSLTRIADHATATSGLQYQSTGMLNYGHSHSHSHHHHHYSSSQAQLQSLTNCPGFVLGGQVDTFRKAAATPIGHKLLAGQQQQQQQRTSQQPGNQYRSHLSLSALTGAKATTTKPMTSASPSMLNEPPSGSLAGTLNRRAQRSGSLSAGHTTPAHLAGSHYLAAAGAATCAGAPSYTPPPPPLPAQSAHPVRPLPPSYSASVGEGALMPVGHCTVQQAAANQSFQWSLGATGGSFGSGNNYENNQHPQATQQQQQQQPTGNRATQAQVQSISSSQIPQEAGAQLNFLSGGHGAASNERNGNNNFSSSSFAASGQPMAYLNQLHNQAPAADQQASAASLNNGPHQQQESPGGLAAHAGVPTKTKSCLTCADISIKWYIVVIALLGLICALIGTIVGAVHSAGRDYISLALLLIGVGLVLVAISWIALRITIKTYKASAQQRRSSGAHGHLNLNLNHTRNHHHHHNHQAPPLGPPLTRLFGLPAPGQSGASHSSLHRSLLNERLYVMAASAAAAAAISRQNADSGGANGRSASRPNDESAYTPTSAATRSGNLIDGIKHRLPRRLQRFLATAPVPGAVVASTAHGTTRGPIDASSYTDRLLAATPTLASGRPRPRPSGLNLEPPTGGGCGSASLPAAAACFTPGELAAATALLYQYQSALSGGSGPGNAPGHTILFPPIPPPHAHLFGPHLPLGHCPEFPYRPPPPSYNAAMQDQRLRMLLQERAGLQHMNASMFPSANPPPPPPLPPPSAHLAAARANGSGATEPASGTPEAARPQRAAAEAQAQPDRPTTIVIKGRHAQAAEQPTAGGSTPLPPAASSAMLVNNDIYEPAHLAGEGASPGGGGSRSSQSTIVSIGAGRSADHLDLAGSRAPDAADGPPEAHRRRKSEVKILGHL